MGGMETQEYVLYKRRWYILALFSLVVCCQNAFWNTFGAIEPYVLTRYNTSRSMVNFLSSLGPIVFIPTSLVSVWFVDRFGLRKTVISTAALCGSGALIRCIFIDGFKYNIIFPIIGQSLNNAAGPMSMILQPKLSSVWFAPSERTFATAVGFQANTIGLSGCFLISMLVHKASDIPFLLYVYAAAGVVTFLLTVIYFPNKPPSPPSYTGEISAGDVEDNSPLSVLKNSLQAMTGSFSAFILIVFGSCPSGVYSAWGALLVEIVTPLGYTGDQAEWFGFWGMIAGGIGGVVFGKAHDLYKRYKFWLLLLFFLDLGAFVWFTLITSHTIKGSYGMALTANILVGLLMGAPSGIIMEGIVELTFPVPEQTGVNVFAILFNLWSLFFLGAGDYITPTMMNWILCGTIIATIIALTPMKEIYKRSSTDVGGMNVGYQKIQ